MVGSINVDLAMRLPRLPAPGETVLGGVLAADLTRWAGAQFVVNRPRPRTDAGERWGCRLECYLTDRPSNPDVSTWHTELAFRLAD